ncbi:hypothetical protein NIES22_13790 [Calothrix brevissima NIES-22]|nr:hypothetical protein NIES22_13790 [Calothrix brevissima NIES-22]
MNFKTISIGLAATCSTLAVGSTFGVAPTQAATITGIVNITGNAVFKNGNEYGKDTPKAGETITFSEAKVNDKTTTGSFTSYIGQSVTIPKILLSFISGSTKTGSFGETIHEYTSLASSFNPFITFSDGLKFEVKDPFKIIKGSFNDPAKKSVYAGSNSFSGNFIDQNNNVIGSGLFTLQQQKIKKNAPAGSFSMTISAHDVPEPLTILGSVTALGMGVALKKKQVQNLAKNKVTA